MKIPNKLKAFGRFITVKKVKAATDIDSKVNCIGRYDSNASSITLATKETESGPLSKDSVCEAFLHEIIHVANGFMLEPDRRLDEGQVQQISIGLFSLMRDNKLRFDVSD